MELLKVENLHKSFGSLEVLKGINFTMKKGEVIAIIGSSGSGKSTLLRCLNFLEDANVGKITVSDDVLYDSNIVLKKREKEAGIRKKRLHFGLVFQNFNLFPQYNVTQNVTLALDLKTKERCKKEKLGKAVLAQNLAENKVTASAIIERVGLSDKIDSYPCELSGGQQQRVAIARALALNPDILCFDEPTSALDPELTGEVLKVIRGLKSGDSTMIVVTHEMEFARDVADKIIFMSDGIIEEMGAPEEVFGNPQSAKTQNFLKTYLEGK
ncbi:MAG: amino acid ABC transporter ATP-binding protein [Bacillota bacterium]